MSSTLEPSVTMGKNYSDNWHSIKNTKDLTMKQIFDMSAILVSEQDEIHGVKTIDWENFSWLYLSLIGDEQVISLQRNENPQSNTAWEQRFDWFKSTSEYTTLDRIDGESMEFGWNIFPGFKNVAAQSRSSKVVVKIE